LTLTGDVLSGQAQRVFTIPSATTSVRGEIRVGANLTISGDILSAPAPISYVLPEASASVRGKIRIV